MYKSIYLLTYLLSYDTQHCNRAYTAGHSDTICRHSACGLTSQQNDHWLRNWFADCRYRKLWL